MAKLYGEIAAKALLTLDKSFARANGQPLDASEVYYSLDAAKAYAATAQAYVGQKIVVIEDNVVTHYSVEDTAGNLKGLGSAAVGDENSITVNDDGSISLYGIDSLVFERDIIGEDGQPTGEKENVQYQPLMTESGLVWVEPSKTTVEGLNTLLEALTKRVDTLEDTVDNLEFTGVATDDKVLSITDKLISSTISLGYDEENKAIKLYGKTDSEGVKAELGSVDATPFIKDGMLENVEYNAENNTLTFTWNTAAGITEDTVVLSDIIEPYTQGNGIEIDGNSIKIKLAEDSESFLTISEAGLKLSGVQDAINAAKQAAIDDAAGKYATKATAESNATAIENLSGRIDGIVAGGGEPNTINSIKVNGVTQTIATDKSVDITVPVNFTDLTDDSGFNDRIAAAQTKANEAADAATAAQTAANAAQTDVDAVETTVSEQGAKLSNLETTVADHGTRIVALETADTQHAAEYNALKEVVNGHTTTIAGKADQTALDAVSTKTSANETAIKTINETTIPGLNTEIAKKADATDIYTKSEIGAITEGKTLVEMIADAKSEASYDDTTIKALIQGNTDKIAILNGDASTEGSVIAIANAQAKAEVATIVGAAPEAMDTLEEVANWIGSDTTGAAAMAADIAANKTAIEAINNETTGILAVAKKYTDDSIAGLPLATGSIVGLVKVDDKTIQAAEDGTISVKAISTDLLTQGTQELVLDGGNAGIKA